MKALLVGAGGMGRAWARNLHDHEEVTLAGWIDILPDAAKLAAETERLSVGYVGSDLVTAIQTVQPDFVVDVTPPGVHCHVTTTALRHGVPVLGEKPMASSLEEAKAMVLASEEAGKLYMVSQSRRYNRQIVAFRNLIRDHLGDLGILNADFYVGPHFGGFRDDMPSPLLLDMAIHTFDEARYLCGADPVAVYAEEFNPSWSWYKGASSAIVLFEMGNGARFTYRGSWCAEGIATSWDGNWRAVGEKGTAVWENDQLPRAQVVTATGGFFSDLMEVETGEVMIDEQIRGSLNEFLWALSTGGTPQGECHDNIKSLAMVFGAIESAKTGKRLILR